MARKTKADAEATREALLDAAEDIFFEKGVARTTLEQIARHAGMTRGAVYWHFKNKADLFHAMSDRVHLPFEELTRELDAPQQGHTPIETIRLTLRHALMRIEQPRHRRVLSIILHRCEFFSDINPLQMQHRMANDCYRSMLRHFEMAERAGQLAPGVDATRAAQMMEYTIGGMLHDWLRTPEEYSLTERGRGIIDSLLDLLSRDTAEPSSPADGSA
ncbi:TetR family transcriptional regulator [Halomonas sp. YLGW01]|uniref:TetR family transcriptional regulator n=1 Tax=Halomonas sp. YLGW01 TaxID=2773308 RepID=UPI00177F7FB9|nr:TetR family transcriptional regulator [Halomonas sp. YLGW01]